MWSQGVRCVYTSRLCGVHGGCVSAVHGIWSVCESTCVCVCAGAHAPLGLCLCVAWPAAGHWESAGVRVLWGGGNWATPQEAGGGKLEDTLPQENGTPPPLVGWGVVLCTCPKP